MLMNPVENEMMNTTELPVAVAVVMSPWEEEMNEILEQERQIAEKKKEIMIKRKLGSLEFQKSFLEEQKVRMSNKIVFRKTKIEEAKAYIRGLEEEIDEWNKKIDGFETDIENYTETIESIDGIDFDDEDLDIEEYIIENFKEEAVAYATKPLEDAVVAQITKPKKSSAKKSSTTAAAKKPAGEKRGPRNVKGDTKWDKCPAGTMFRLKHSEDCRYYKKDDIGRLLRCNDKGETIMGVPTYSYPKEAVDKFKTENNLGYSLQTWRHMKLYNPATKAVRVLEKWDENDMSVFVW